MDSRFGSDHQCFETVLSIGTRQYSGLVMLGARVLVRKKDKFKLSRQSFSIVMDDVIRAERLVAGAFSKRKVNTALAV